MNKLMRGLGQLTNQPSLGLHIDNLQNQQIAVKYYTVGAWLNILSNCLMQTRIILKHLKHDMRDFASYKKDDFFSLKSKKWWQSHHTMPRHFFHLHYSGQVSEMSPLSFFPAQVISRKSVEQFTVIIQVHIRKITFLSIQVTSTVLGLFNKLLYKLTQEIFSSGHH